MNNMERRSYLLSFAVSKHIFSSQISLTSSKMNFLKPSSTSVIKMQVLSIKVPAHHVLAVSLFLDVKGGCLLHFGAISITFSFAREEGIIWV